MKVVCVSGPAVEQRVTAAVELVRQLMAAGHKTALVKEGPPAGGPELDAAPGPASELQLPRVALWSFKQSICFLGDLPLNELLDFLNADWVVVEGFHESDLPKVLVLPEGQPAEPWIDQLTFLALGGPGTRAEVNGRVPVLDLNSTRELARTVMEKTPPRLPNLTECGFCGLSCREVTRRMLAGEGDISLCRTLSAVRVQVEVGGEPVAMKPFVEEAFAGVIQGFLKSLKGVNVNREIRVRIPGADQAPDPGEQA